MDRAVRGTSSLERVRGGSWALRQGRMVGRGHGGNRLLLETRARDVAFRIHKHADAHNFRGRWGFHLRKSRLSYEKGRGKLATYDQRGGYLWRPGMSIVLARESPRTQRAAETKDQCARGDAGRVHGRASNSPAGGQMAVGCATNTATIAEAVRMAAIFAINSSSG